MAKNLTALRRRSRAQGVEARRFERNVDEEGKPETVQIWLEGDEPMRMEETEGVKGMQENGWTKRNTVASGANADDFGFSIVSPAR